MTIGPHKKRPKGSSLLVSIEIKILNVSRNIPHRLPTWPAASPQTERFHKRNMHYTIYAFQFMATCQHCSMSRGTFSKWNPCCEKNGCTVRTQIYIRKLYCSQEFQTFDQEIQVCKSMIIWFWHDQPCLHTLYALLGSPLSFKKEYRTPMLILWKT